MWALTQWIALARHPAPHWLAVCAKGASPFPSTAFSPCPFFGIKQSSMVTEAARVATPEQPGVLARLKPHALWGFFEELSRIPRPSKYEQRVLAWLKSFAEARGLEWEQDDVGNMVIRRPGCGGGQHAPPVVVQGHVDMVCEKNEGVAHDFMTDPIRLQLSDDWVTATGTTLGADNGIGVAAALALLDLPAADAKLPPLECLFTVDEETGLTGAYNVSPKLLQGRTMLNLDTEDWGEVFIGCAGGGDSRLTLLLETVPAPLGMAACNLKVAGLLGGHSGLNIGEGRANAVQLLVRALRAVTAAEPGALVRTLSGGDKRNAIAREANALLLLPSGTGSFASAQAAVHEVHTALRMEFGTLETGLSVKLQHVEAQQQQQQPTTVLAPTAFTRLLDLLSVLPHGVLKQSHGVPGLVETSSNLASVHIMEQVGGPPTALIVTSTRSSLGPALEAVRDGIQAAAALAGATMDRGRAYPGWQPRLHSAVLAVTKQCYKDLTGRDARISAIHAGLECGILGERFPGMDMVSFGPTIKGAHSPDERCQVSTVEPFWLLTLSVLSRLADRR